MALNSLQQAPTRLLNVLHTERFYPLARLSCSPQAFRSFDQKHSYSTGFLQRHEEVITRNHWAFHTTELASRLDWLTPRVPVAQQSQTVTVPSASWLKNNEIKHHSHQNNLLEESTWLQMKTTDGRGLVDVKVYIQSLGTSSRLDLKILVLTYYLCKGSLIF